MTLGEKLQIKDIVREDDGSRQEQVLTLVADTDEVAAGFRSFFDDISQREIPGFRKGKAPREMLEQSVGGHANAMGGVAECIINEFAIPAIDESGVIFISEPTFNVDAMVEEGKPFTFTVSGAVAPEMSLTGYGPVSIEMPPEEPTEAEVEDQINAIQDHYHSFEAIEDPSHKAQMGDYVVVEMTVTNDGKLVSGMRNARRMIGLGEGTMPESFDSCIIGSKKGDTLEFDFEAKDEDGTSEYGDGNLHAVVEIKDFRKYVLPEVDDALAEKVGCADVDDMRHQLTQAIAVQKAKDLPKLKVDRVVDAALDRLDGDVPEYYVEFIRQDVGREFMQALQEQGTNLQEWMLQNAVNGDEMKDDIAREAHRRAAIDCMLEAVFRESGLQVTDDDMDAMFGKDGALIREDWENAHRMAYVKKMCRQQKATEYLVENADVKIVR